MTALLENGKYRRSAMAHGKLAMLFCILLLFQWHITHLIIIIIKPTGLSFILCAPT